MKWDRSRGRPEPIRALNRVVEKENGEPLVSLLEFSPSVLILRESVIPFLRRTVADSLERAALSLPSGYQIGVIDAWRPFQRQVRIYDFMWNCMKEVHPDMSYAAMRRAVCRFVAPVDQKAPPGHCTGAAVDVFLVDGTGEALDVSSPYTRFEGAPTYVYGLSEIAQKNRTILVNAMLEAGFSNCRDEWWHYSIGDAGWAVRTEQTECYYGKIELDPELYRLQEEDWLIKLKDRENPFLES